MVQSFTARMPTSAFGLGRRCRSSPQQLIVMYDTIWNAILTCSIKLTWVSLIYRMERATKKWGKKHTHTHPFNGPFLGLPRWAGTRKVKPIWILLKQETVSGSSISWAICKSAPRSRQITMPTPHHSVFYRLDALPAAQPTASKLWRLKSTSKKTDMLRNIDKQSGECM